MLSLQIAGQGNIINNSKLANWWWYGRGGGGLADGLGIASAWDNCT